MADLGLVVASCVLGFVSHLFFRRYEPHSANIAVPILVTIPPALLILLHYAVSLGSILTVYVAFLSALSASIVVYRLSPFHPLAAYPGPVLGKATQLWILGIATAAGHQYLYLKKLHDQYGPFVRIGPNELSMIDAAAANQILGPGGLNKGRYFTAGRHASTPPTIVSLIGDAHTSKRRVWNRGMTSPAIREYNVFLVKRTQQLIERLQNQTTSVDIVFWLDLFALDLMGDLSFGGGFESMKEGRDKDLIGSRIRGFMKYVFFFLKTPAKITSLIPELLTSQPKFPGLYQHCIFCRKLANLFKNSMISDINLPSIEPRMAHLLEQKICGTILYADEAGLEKERPTLESSAADGIVAIIAASDTTVSAIACCIWLMITHPGVYQKVQTELDQVFPDANNLDGIYDPEHQELEYLSACIQETLRLHPPLPSNGGPRQAQEGDREISGRVIPAGTSVYTPTYALHHRPDYFSDPDKFIPERWLSSNAEPKDLEKQTPFNAHETSAFMPFSLGPANCVGQRFAKREMLHVLSMLLCTFDFKFDKGSREVETIHWTDSIKEFFVATRGPMKVQLTRRSAVQVSLAVA
ncbi:hypothetical protein HMN09_00011800 [Mycena chlorophos]|uniref:Cytochrome P450 n=1 Tax=Mycena chlorophos TaxID=658473 RepID=A0A8H6TS63_MYCCL|nr:hypothetical protein HMN09_00011800 [Mycena chlorophos]